MISPSLYFTQTIPSPVGTLTLVADQTRLRALFWEGYRPTWSRAATYQAAPDHKVLKTAARQIQEYFEGRRKDFDVPIRYEGTPFQVRVWQALQKIPYGETRSYSKLAQTIGHPLACRAVGSANRRNPLGIIVPCHRVVGASGALTGFAGGLRTKKLLLELEGSPIE